ncbi:MAG: hypothetical protein RLY93_14335 [Sumerlaeia bacterium]
MHSFFRFPFLVLLLLAAIPPCSALAQDSMEENPATSLGVLTPFEEYEATAIAIPAFDRDDNAPVEWQTVPRIIRRDLELSGLFNVTPDKQAWVNSQNLRDVRGNKGIDFAAWSGEGFELLLMGRVRIMGDNVVEVTGYLWDVESKSRLFGKSFRGPADQLRLVTHQLSDEIVRAVKSMDGVARTQILFVNEQIPGIKEAALMDADGFNQRLLTNYGKIVTVPAWGANGTEFYYTSYHGNRANVYGQQFLDGGTWKIAAYGGTNHAPQWCAANERLVMVLSKDGNSEIYTCKRDGSDLKRVTESRATEGSPTWSPDGSKIAFASDEAGGIHLFVVNADGTGKRRLTSKGGWNDAPSWSPDGKRIAFVSRIGGKNDIYVLDADGSPDSYRRLTKDVGNNESPDWAPNSRHLVFSSDRSGKKQIYIMLDDGSNQRVLTGSGFSNTVPEWGPYPG